MLITLQGDVRETLKTLPSDSVHCVVTSVPYHGLRSYLPQAHPLKHLEIGSESTLEEYLITMVKVFREIRRVLHPSGTLWLNVGSSYASANTYSSPARRSPNAPACGTGGKEPQDYLRPDCACHGHDDECQGDLQTRRDRIGRTGQLGARSDALAVQTIHDNAPTDSDSVAAPSHVAQQSTIPASTGNDPGASCPEGIALEPRTAGGSSPDDVPPSADTGQHTGDTLSQLRTLVDRIEDREPLDLAFAYCSIVSRGVKAKDLINQPSMIAEALRLDGWFIRSDICWAKRSTMPESVTDRPTSAWEHIWLFTKSARYFYDAEAVRQPGTTPREAVIARVEAARKQKSNRMKGANLNEVAAVEGWSGDKEAWSDGCANLRNFWLLEDHTALVRWLAEHHPDALKQYSRECSRLSDCWLLGPEPYSEAHFATFPSEIPKRAILAGTSARGCCPKCLAPWERVVDVTYSNWTEGNNNGIRKGQIPEERMTFASGKRCDKKTRTTGWQPTCRCDAGDPIPCTVLDPFGGSGTTAAVAIELGRKAILCELNPAYIAMIRDRTNVTPGLHLA